MNLSGLKKLCLNLGASLWIWLPQVGCTSSATAPEESGSATDIGPMVSQRTTGTIIPFAPREQIVSKGLYAPGSSTSVALWKTRATIGDGTYPASGEVTLELVQGGGISETADLQLVAPLVRFEFKDAEGNLVGRDSLRRDIAIDSIVDRFIDQPNIVVLIVYNFGKPTEERWLLESKYIQFQIAEDQSRTVGFPMRDTSFVFSIAAIRPKKVPQGWRLFTPPPPDGTNLTTYTTGISDTASQVGLTWTPPEGSASGYAFKTSYAPFDTPACVGGKNIESQAITSIRSAFPPVKTDSMTISGLLDGQKVYVQLCSKNTRDPADVSEGLVITYDVPKRAKAELKNAPSASTNLTTLDVKVTGNGLLSYKYALIPNANNCLNATYSSWFLSTILIQDNLSEIPYTLCVIGLNSETNLQKNPTELSFIVDRTPPQTFSVPSPSGVLTNRKPEITWGAASGADSYEVRIASDNQCSSVVKAVTVTSPKLNDIALSDGSYYLCVTARDAAGNSTSQSNGVVAFSVDATPPGSFSITSPLSGSAVYTNTPQISWSSASGATSYGYIVGDDAACHQEVLKVENVLGTSATTAPLSPGAYYLCITAKDNAGNQTPASNMGLPFEINTGEWASMTAPGAALTPRSKPLSVWAPSYGQLLVWGGVDNSGSPLQSGALYDPSADQWQPITNANAPTARTGTTALWTSSIMRMIVWGGEDGNHTLLNDGSFYEPGGSWVAMDSTAAPMPRKNHTAILANSTMIVWGGTACSGTPGCASQTLTQTGGIFHINANSWQSGGTDTSDIDLPSARSQHSAIWTGSSMIIWGGSNGVGPINTGGRYTPGTPGEWSSVTTLNAPSPRQNHVAIWTGSKMLIWGGYGCLNYPSCTQWGNLNDGGLYDPLSDSWATVNGAGALSPRAGTTALWDPVGLRLFVWAGTDNGAYFNDGGMISPTLGWIVPRLDSTNAPSARAESVGVWAGSSFIIFGGTNGSLQGSGARFTPP